MTKLSMFQTCFKSQCALHLCKVYHRFQIKKHIRNPSALSHLLYVSISRGWEGLVSASDITDNVEDNDEGSNEDDENADENTETDLDHVEVDLPVVPRSRRYESVAVSLLLRRAHGGDLLPRHSRLKIFQVYHKNISRAGQNYRRHARRSLPLAGAGRRSPDQGLLPQQPLLKLRVHGGLEYVRSVLVLILHCRS